MDILTIDCEDFLSLPAFSKIKSELDWDLLINQQIDVLLEVLEKANSTKATFFIVGDLAKRNPYLVTKIVQNGHQIGSHSFNHVFINKLSNSEFEHQLIKSIDALEAIIGKSINCFRAPFWSYSKDMKKYWEILERNSIKYDSSILPTSRYLFGSPKSKRFINYPVSNIMEFPPSTIRFLGINFPFSGGIYFRILPYFIINTIIKRIHRKGNCVTMYFHPWELDPKLIRISGISFFYKFILYYNNRKGLTKFKRLLNDWNFTSIENYVQYNNLES